MNTPLPHHNGQIVGHEAALADVKVAFSSGRMPQAWLISGPVGIGKATLAYHIANYVMSEGKNPLGALNMENPVARLIAAEAHPDLFVLKRGVDDKTGLPDASISADAARKIAPFLHKTATQGAWRVSIIDEAQALNRYGQNAILKVIEEPPKKSLVLITVTTPGLLLPTIRSRCRMLPLRPLADASMRTLFSRFDVEGDREELAHLIRMAEGSIGFALQILSAEAMPLYNDMLEIMKALPQLNIDTLHTLAEQIGRKADGESFTVLRRLLLAHLRASVRQTALSPDSNGQLDCALQLWEKVDRIFDKAERANLDRKLAFVNAFTEMRRLMA